MLHLFMRCRPFRQIRQGRRHSAFQISRNLGGDDFGGGKASAIFEGFVFEPEDVEVDLAVTDAKQRPGFPSPASPAAALRVALG